MKKTAKSINIYTHDIPKALAVGLRTEHNLWGDTETDGLVVRRDRLRLVQLADKDSNIYMIRNPDWKSQNLKDLFNTVRVTFHHAAFDSLFTDYWMDSRPLVGCTKILSKIMYPNQSTSLEKVVLRETGVAMDKNKDTTKSNWNLPELTAEQIRYACEDVLYLKDTEDSLMKKVEESGQMRYYNNAIDALGGKLYLEARGYTDLLQYEPDSNTVSLRNQWLAHKAEMEK